MFGGSTSLAEGMRPAEFRALMDRFFEIAAKVLVRHDAIVDKFVGDEVIGIFVPGFSGKQHAAQAIAAGHDLLRTMVEREAGIPIGVGVHSGIAYVGAVGEGSHVELTAMGDPVNVTARLASAAGAGEMLVTAAAAAARPASTPRPRGSLPGAQGQIRGDRRIRRDCVDTGPEAASSPGQA